MGELAAPAGAHAAEAPIVSVEAKKWAEKHPARTPAQQQVLEALAWASQGRGLGARMSYRAIAAKTKLHRNTVLRALGQLELDDRIVRHRGHGEECERCAGARRGVTVYDVVIPAAPEQVPNGQMSLLATVPVGASASALPSTPERHTKVPDDVPLPEGDWHHGGAGTGTPGVPQGSKGTYQHHHQGNAREVVDQVMDLLSRVRKPGWYVDELGVEAHVMTWSHKDPMRAAASVVAKAMGHGHLNAAMLLGRELEWQRVEQPERAPRARGGATSSSGADLPERFAQYDDAMPRYDETIGAAA